MITLESVVDTVFDESPKFPARFVHVEPYLRNGGISPSISRPHGARLERIEDEDLSTSGKTLPTGGKDLATGGKDLPTGENNLPTGGKSQTTAQERSPKQLLNSTHSNDKDKSRKASNNSVSSTGQKDASSRRRSSSGSPQS